MANDERNRPQAPPAPRTTSSPLEPIRVRELRFCVPNGRDVPLRGTNGGRGSIKAGERSTGEVITIQFEPWQRHHRVREVSNGEVNEFCIPESWALYVPEEPGPA
jgi:hypothetical protein